ncbi:MAG: hypothetical protein JKY48_19925 [Flavobacteriales bacterium]|nr:hypothetical protein [Flavobacteriales bacterium]
MSYQENLNTYDEIVILSSHSERKGKTMPYTSSNGYMYSLLNKAGQLGFRLSKEDQKEFGQEYGGEAFISHNATMKDYILIHDHLLKEKEMLAKWLDKAHDYVNTLKPK